jgi:hypothetical protein
MNSLTTSTLAALEEMLQNAKRNASQDCLPVYFEKTYIGNIGRPLIGAVEELLKNGSYPHIQMDITRIILKSAPPAQLSDDLRALANGLHQAGFIPAFGLSGQPFVPLDFGVKRHISMGIPRQGPYG